MPVPKKTTRHKNITRIDHPAKRTYGYNVRVAWKGKKYGKFFSDGVYGDRLGALAAAIEWRDSTEKKIGKPRTEHQVIGFNSRNKTGYTGIRRMKRGDKDYLEVSWVVYGDRPRKTATAYSITKHGEKKALKLAIRARKRGEQLRWHAPRVRREKPAAPTYTPWIPPV
jgi:hypothetical protein